jgi:hypothetical protein
MISNENPIQNVSRAKQAAEHLDRLSKQFDEAADHLKTTVGEEKYLSAHGKNFEAAKSQALSLANASIPQELQQFKQELENLKIVLSGLEKLDFKDITIGHDQHHTTDEILSIFKNIYHPLAVEPHVHKVKNLVKNIYKITKQKTSLLTEIKGHIQAEEKWSHQSLLLLQNKIKEHLNQDDIKSASKECDVLKKEFDTLRVLTQKVIKTVKKSSAVFHEYAQANEALRRIDSAILLAHNGIQSGKYSAPKVDKDNPTRTI